MPMATGMPRTARPRTQDDAVGARVHAYLHRVEGDLANAAYWYRRAGRPTCDDTLQQEWEEIVTELLRND